MDTHGSRDGGMSIRPLTPTDAAEFRALRLRALRENPEAFTSSFEEDVLQPVEATERRLAADGERFWGAFADGALQGMVGLTREPRAKNRHKGHIVSMYVAPEFRRRSLARALLRTAVAYARACGDIEQLVLTVTLGNAAAHGLYHDEGFRTFGLEPRAIRTGAEYFDKEHMIYFLQSAP